MVPMTTDCKECGSVRYDFEEEVFGLSFVDCAGGTNESRSVCGDAVLMSCPPKLKN